MTELEMQQISSFDGQVLAFHRLKSAAGGKPVLLLHGLFSDAAMNWVKFGHAERLAAAGFDPIMLDFRAHGRSAAPVEAAAYPADVLALDTAAIVEALRLAEYDLVGFSLGARTAVRGVVGGLAPRRLVLAGMGLEGLAGWNDRAAFFIDAIDRFETVKQGDPAFFAVQFMKSMKVNRPAARLLLQSVSDTTREGLAAITMPTLVLCGAQDRDNGSPQALADTLPSARFQEVPGTHMSSVTEAALGEAIVSFLQENTDRD
ncbi:alpha/beta hydrolase [Altererythrobacter sp. SALINAS58]|uniref:alpha/beta fold hydrolase n=1 Tax=Alteripontixanthobacter muriae TaxID=2705546 RepID=UPI00157622E0|nr:alpha/beta fold hydrolase [Alteripontixanthobacter muriae]NTZ43031.1 alpha/beta hydrolase [Alteripontixanthobacter muriae]